MFLHQHNSNYRTEKIVHLSLDVCFLWFMNTLIQFQAIYSVFLNFLYNLFRHSITWYTIYTFWYRLHMSYNGNAEPEDNGRVWNGTLTLLFKRNSVCSTLVCHFDHGKWILMFFTRNVALPRRPAPLHRSLFLCSVGDRSVQVHQNWNNHHSFIACQQERRQCSSDRAWQLWDGWHSVWPEVEPPLFRK